MAFNLDGSPYSLEETGGWVIEEVSKLQRQVDMLRGEGHLSDTTLRAYFGDKRFEQIAESNAIEGSTLSVGETEMAVLQGTTFTGHDPAYTKDAINLSMALERMVELARDKTATNIEQVKELHQLILGGSLSAGLFRSEPVRISGSPHVPPPTWEKVMSEMEEWEAWSNSNADAPALFRSIVLHTWLTHIHPFVEGNGRASRAVMNLELIRAGFPSIIIRRRDRLRYYEALAESDTGGDLGLVSELILVRAKDALRDLERAATAHQGYSRIQAELQKAQERQVEIWNAAVRLLYSSVHEALEAALGGNGEVLMHWYEDELSVDDYAALSKGDPAGNSWLFRVNANVPGVGNRRYLAWTGFRSYEIKEQGGIDDGPSIFWSVPDPSGSRKWVQGGAQSPGVVELTLELPDVDLWIVKLADGQISQLKPSGVARRIAEAVGGSISSQ